MAALGSLGIVSLALSLTLTGPPSLVAEAQQAGRVYRVGFLSPGRAPNDTDLAAFLGQLRRLGYVEGQNVVVETRYAERQFNRLPTLANELVQAKVDVIVTITTPAAVAARDATAAIPIVMAGSADPVKRGLIASLARPGGNVTGVTNSPGPEFAGKQLQLLKEAAPRISRVAVLMDPGNAAEVDFLRAIEVVGRTLDVTAVSIEVVSPTQFDPTAITRARADALYVMATAVNWAHRQAIFDVAVKHRLPAMYGERDWVDAGGLMSYWTNWMDLRRDAAVYVDRILRGTKPADLPVANPTKFELIVNLRTARALGLTIPPAILARADEVIHPCERSWETSAVRRVAPFVESVEPTGSPSRHFS